MSSLGGIYSTGTISVVANGTTVTGVGTLWTLVAQQGDWFFANGNIGVVNSVTDDTHIVLSLAWTGGTLTNVTYNLLQMSWSRYDPSLTQAKVRNFLAALANMAIIYAVPTNGSPDPSIGDNGQYALDFVNGRWWQKSGGVWVGGIVFAGTPSPPQGRLTLATGTPVMTSDVAGATTIYYTPHIGAFVPIYNGTAWTMINIGGELSQLTTDATKSPAAVVANSNYDIFIWIDSGTTIRATRGPPWSTDITRGSGAGTTQLQMISGFWTNAQAIANGPGANLGTYVGTVRSNASSQIDWKMGTAAAGGGMATLGVWNAYNRVLVSASVSDTTNNWTYASATIRAANGSATNRINFVSGLTLDCIDVAFHTEVTPAAVQGAPAVIGFGMDTTTSYDRRALGVAASALSYIAYIVALGAYKPQRGFHYVSALESTDGSTGQFYGIGYNVMGLELKFMM